MALDHPTFDSMSLLDRQFLLTRMLPRLLEQIYFAGFRCTMGESWRSKETQDIYVARGSGSPCSVHPLRLAVDINLFDKDNNYLSSSGSHEPFGRFWKSLHPLCRWGGDFPKPDGNHYSIAYEGRA